MRFLFRLALIAALTRSIPCVAQSDLDGYLALRDRYHATAQKKFDAAWAEINRVRTKPDDKATAEAFRHFSPCPSSDLPTYRRWHSALQDRIRAIIGPISIPQFNKAGTYEPETFCPEMGADLLDSLQYQSRNRKITLTLTTLPILRHWLAATRANFDGKSAPQDPNSALRDERFYSTAISEDERYYKFSDISIRTPNGADFAFAMLTGHGNDFPLEAPPREIVATLVQQGRVFILVQETSLPIAIPECDKILRAVTEAHHFDDAESEADQAARSCFASHLYDQPRLQEILNQAQSLIALVSRP
jgi:hypothetical protein